MNEKLKSMTILDRFDSRIVLGGIVWIQFERFKQLSIVKKADEEKVINDVRKGRRYRVSDLFRYDMTIVETMIRRRVVQQKIGSAMSPNVVYFQREKNTN